MEYPREGKVVCWNVKDGLADPERAYAIAELIAAQKPTVVVLCEAARTSQDIPDEIIQILGKTVGDVFPIDYDDRDGRVDTHSLVMVVLPEYGTPSKVKLGRRNALRLGQPGELTILGYHALDRMPGGSRHAHGAVRTAQARKAIDLIGDGPALVVGDLNDMHRRNTAARLIRPFGGITGMLPYGEPGKPQSKLERVGSLSQRLWAMAGGESLDVYGEEGFHDADPGHQPTMELGPIAVQLDHILARGCGTSDFRVIPPGDLSDHSMITARYSLPQN